MFSLLVGILGDIFGFLNISIVLIDTSINATIIALIVGVYIVITNSAILVFLQTGFAAKSNIIKAHKDIIGKYLIKISVFIWLFLWTRYVLISLGIFSYIYNWFVNLIDISWKIGSVTISLEGILGFFTVIIITYFLQRIIKNLLDNEVYPRITLPRGVSGTISMSVSYSIVLAGIYIALAAAGIDFGKFTFLQVHLVLVLALDCKT